MLFSTVSGIPDCRIISGRHGSLVVDGSLIIDGSLVVDGF
jgi:hypothetical protein